MKFRFFAAAALLLGLSVGCQQEELNSLSEIQISNKYVSIPQAGGSQSIDITTTADWKVDTTKFPQWLTLNPMQGGAGEGRITLSAGATEETRTVDLKLLCAGKTQLLRVMQQAEVGEPEIITCKEAVDLIKAGTQGTKTYYVKGIVCALIDISVQYGNATFWMSDNGVFNESDGQNLQVYRSTWLNGGKITTGDEIAVGDEIVVSGCLIDYKGTPETQEKTTTVVSITKSLIKCDSLVVDGAKIEELPLEGGAFSAMLMCKGKGVSVSVPDNAKSWLSVSGVKTGDATAVVDFYAAKNEGGDRSTEVTFSTSDGSKDYTAKATVSQKGSILEVSIAEFNAAAVGDAQYRISGIVTKLEQDSEKYGANLYIKDFSGETYIYGTTDATGAVKTLASFGAKEGDIVEFVGKRGEFNGKPQISKAVYQLHKTVTVKTAAEVAALADDDKNDPKNYVMVTGVVTDGSSIPGHKFDLETYGNFELVDESGSAYVYGVSTGWKGETKKFGTLGVKEGDKLTIIAYKTSYTDKTTGTKTDELVGMYVSHKSGETPEPVVSEYSIELAYELGNNATDEGKATINGVADQKVLKIGTSSLQGSLSVTIPAGACGMSFYAIAWRNKATKLECKVDQAVLNTLDINANEGATSNSPYTITVSDTDKYEVNLGGTAAVDTKITVTTPAATASGNQRVILFGVKALTEKK